MSSDHRGCPDLLDLPDLLVRWDPLVPSVLLGLLAPRVYPVRQERPDLLVRWDPPVLLVPSDLLDLLDLLDLPVPSVLRDLLAPRVP